MRKALRAFPYYGGKARLTEELISCFSPAYTSFYEPFIGGGSVTFNLENPDGKKIVINDFDTHIANFYKVLEGSEGERLIEELCSIEINERTFKEAKRYMLYNPVKTNRRKSAVCTYIEIVASFSAMRQNFARRRKEGAYLRGIQNNLPKIRERLQEGIEIRNQNALDILQEIKHDTEAMVYLDPPYLMRLRNGKGYRHEMREFEHIKMLNILSTCKCKVLLSGYRSEHGNNLYDSWLVPYGYNVYRLCEVVKSCQSTHEKGKGVEYIWCNYDLPETASFAQKVIVENF